MEEKVKVRVRLLKMMLDGVLDAVHQFKDELTEFDSDFYFDVENALADTINRIALRLYPLPESDNRD